MGEDLPDFYFRVKENGALAFRVNTENRQRRIELDHIATINVNNGNVRATGDRDLTGDEQAAIDDWLASRREVLAGRELDDILRAVDHLNLTAHWVQSKATDAQLDAMTDPLLLAMHDLRSVLVRKKADRIGRERSDDA
ncbi:hypothetical protein [Wenxinia saemankumensis]|uniref:Uncharacterized protein n=1 Tax=Wenxinia saemankumensis TaxID=1447782 RepID=A0A1M6CDT1_9RHOB|nr:hypothetical protein [Wenxinia saemankumensis]SHI59169.1 hypothetical protein SAMN05444417_1142 [Wenxinia saemankumensis]